MSWGSRHGKNATYLFSDIEYLLFSSIQNNGSLLTNECVDIVGDKFNAIKFNVNKKLIARKESTIQKEFYSSDGRSNRVYKYFIG